MRRDVCHFYETDVATVYNAYLSALGNDKFDRECREEPYHTLTFGLNFSVKYNFNGGSCIVHFIPYQGGTAVDLRFVLAQAAGARYEKYDRDLTDDVIQILGIPARPLELDIEVFMDEKNKVTPDTFVPPAPAPTAPAPAYAAPPPPAPAAPTPVPTQVPAYAATQPPVSEPAVTAPPAQRVCTQCGHVPGEEDVFCGKCGTRLPEKKRFCGKCGKEAGKGDAFCTACGNKL